MADMEQDIDLEIDNEEQDNNNQENNLDISDEDRETLQKFWIDPSKATVTDLVNLAKRTIKSENKIVEEKKKTKETNSNPDVVTTQDLELRDSITEFVAINPELKEHKSELTKYVKQWFSLMQAKAIVENDDKTIENRKKMNAMNLTNTEWTTKSTYTKEELEKMSQSEYNRVMDLKDKGKVFIK